MAKATVLCADLAETYSEEFVLELLNANPAWPSSVATPDYQRAEDAVIYIRKMARPYIEWAQSYPASVRLKWQVQKNYSIFATQVTLTADFDHDSEYAMFLLAHGDSLPLDN